jgi:hypothetical protein
MCFKIHFTRDYCDPICGAYLFGVKGRITREFLKVTCMKCIKKLATSTILSDLTLCSFGTTLNNCEYILKNSGFRCCDNCFHL